MKWLTKAYIRKQAQKSIRAALECSLEHWKQLAKASDAERMDAIKRGRVRMHEAYCACCMRFQVACYGCLLYTNKGCCDGLWDRARRANDKMFRRYARNVRNHIAKVLRQHMKEAKK